MPGAQLCLAAAGAGSTAAPFRNEGLVMLYLYNNISAYSVEASCCRAARLTTPVASEPPIVVLSEQHMSCVQW